MFEATADYYDAFYDALDKDYEREARKVLRLVRQHKREPRTLLDVACGTGRHLEVFSRSLDVVGVDIDREMLRVARRRCPRAELRHGDMTTLDVGRTFDVVTCLFSSIAYVRTLAALRTSVRRMAAHLAPGGVVVVEPWFVPDEWHDGHLGMLTIDDETHKAVRISRSSRRGAMSVLDFDYLLADAKGTRHVTERHELRLFEWDEYLDAFDRAGLDVDVDDYGLFGRGLILGAARR